jgi:hypothetical protein
MIIRSEVRLASPSHLTGRGGSKAAVLQTVAAARENTFVFRSDVKSYYASIRHDIRMREVGRFVDDPIALDLIHQYADRMMCDGGVYVSRRFTRRFQVLRFGENLIAKRQTLRPLSNSDSDVRDYSGDGMKSSGSSIVTFSVMGTVQPDQTIHLRLSIWLRILDQPTARRLFDKFGCLSNSFRQKRTIDALHNRANRSR